MEYMLLIYRSQKEIDALSPDEMGALMKDFGALDAALESRGALVSSKALQPTTTATTVQVRDGRTLTTDGPFAETKEQLGGYYVVEAKDLDEAIELAALIPISRVGSIEVRPVRTMS